LKKEVKKESKTPVKEECKEAVVAVHVILGEVLDEVVAWGWPDSSEEDWSSSTEDEAKEGDSGESESAENISDGELEWLAKDLREVLALPENKLARLNRGAKVRGSRRVLKEGLGQVQQELEQRRRGRKRLKSSSSGRYQRPGYIPTQADAFNGVRKLLSFKVLESYDEEDDKDYIQPEDEMLPSEDDEMLLSEYDEILHLEDGDKSVTQFEIEGTKREIKDKEQKLEEHDRRIEERNRKVEEKERKIEEMEKELEEIKKELEEKVRVKDERDRNLEEQERKVEEKEREIEEIEKEVEEIEKELEEKDLDEMEMKRNKEESRVPAIKRKVMQGHISPAKAALFTIFEEDERETGKEVAGDYWQEGDHKATLEENPGVEVGCFDYAPSLLRCADLRTVKESVEGLVQHTIQDEHEVSLKCLEDNSIEEVIKVEEVCSNNEYREDEHLEETEKKVGGIGDETGSQYQAANRTLPDEVLSGLRGLDGAILLLQKARLDLLRQVGLPAADGVNPAMEGDETNVGKCYQPGCLRRAAHKCGRCLQVQYCSSQCQELAWGQHHREECDQLAPLQ